MSGTSLQLQFKDNTAALGRALRELQRAGESPRSLLLDMGEYLVDSTQARFDAEVDPEGIPWTALSAMRIDQKRTDKILTESTRLRRSIVYRVAGTSLEWGTNVIYSRIHQEGMSGPVQVPAHQRLVKKVFGRTLAFPVWADVPAHTMQQEIPARPYLGLNGADADELIDRAHEYLREALRQGGAAAGG